jgi:hypothetical protein
VVFTKSIFSNSPVKPVNFRNILRDKSRKKIGTKLQICRFFVLFQKVQFVVKVRRILERIGELNGELDLCSSRSGKICAGSILLEAGGKQFQSGLSIQNEIKRLVSIVLDGTDNLKSRRNKFR